MRRGAPRRQTRRRNDIAGLNERRGARTGMTVDARGGNVSEINADGEIRQRRQVEIERVGINRFASRNVDGWRAVKRERQVGGAVDVAAARTAGSQSDVNGIHRHQAGSKGVGKTRPQMTATQADTNELTERAVGQRHRRQISRFGQLRATAPSRHPMPLASNGFNLGAAKYQREKNAAADGSRAPRENGKYFVFMEESLAESTTAKVRMDGMCAPLAFEPPAAAGP